jgi:hypothetical protein
MKYILVGLTVLMLSGCEGAGKNPSVQTYPAHKAYHQNSNPNVTAAKMMSPVM